MQAPNWLNRFDSWHSFSSTCWGLLLDTLCRDHLSLIRILNTHTPWWWQPKWWGYQPQDLPLKRRWKMSSFQNKSTLNNLKEQKNKKLKLKLKAALFRNQCIMNDPEMAGFIHPQTPSGKRGRVCLIREKLGKNKQTLTRWNWRRVELIWVACQI